MCFCITSYPLKSHLTCFDVTVMNISDEEDRWSLYTVRVNLSRSNSAFKERAGNVSTAEVVTMFLLKQLLSSVFTGLHDQL